MEALEPTLEFRSIKEDAWYGVRLVLSGDTLTVKYCNFSDEHDERFKARDFKTLKEVDDFEDKFRLVSVQLQDLECKKVIEGIMVCASYAFSEDDIRFYDAFVEQVDYKEHSFAKGEEECSCRFMLFWQHGPNAGNLTIASVGDICLIQSVPQNDLTLATFLKISREKLEKSLLKSNVKHKSRLMETKRVRQSGEAVLATEDQLHHGGTGQDTDLGGETLLIKKFKKIDYHHIVLIENLEKDLPPSTIVDFLHKQTNIITQAFVFPSLSSDTYTRGTIVLDCKEQLDKLYCFLDSPNLIITSSRGRPWVITEKFPGLDKVFTGMLMPNSNSKLQSGTGSCDELKVVPLGTKEFTTAKKLKDLFMNFSDHQKGLHKRLALEEKKIMQL